MRGMDGRGGELHPFGIKSMISRQTRVSCVRAGRRRGCLPRDPGTYLPRVRGRHGVEEGLGRRAAAPGGRRVTRRFLSVREQGESRAGVPVCPS
jgi:hypothetical protein